MFVFVVFALFIPKLVTAEVVEVDALGYQVGQSSTTEPDLFGCNSGNHADADFKLSVGRCVRKDIVPPPIIPPIPGRMPLIDLSLPLLKDSDGFDKPWRYLTVPFFALVGIEN